MWGEKFFSAAIQGCGSLTFWLKDSDKQQVHPAQCSEIFTSAGLTVFSLQLPPYQLKPWLPISMAETRCREMEVCDFQL